MLETGVPADRDGRAVDLSPMKTLQEFKTAVPQFGMNDYFRHLAALEAAAGREVLKPLRIAVLRSYTVESVGPVLKFRLLLEGYRPEFFFGGYNQFVQEVLDASSPLYAFRPDIVLVMARIEELLPDFVGSFGSKTPDEWRQSVEQAVQQLATLAEMIEGSLSSPVIFQNMSLFDGPYWGIYDAQHPDGQTYLAQEMNRLLAQALRPRQGAFLWDFDRLVRTRGQETIHDPKMWYLSKNPYKQSAYPLIADDLLRYLLSILGKVKKCIVLDLDNTLWGGIAGEDGMGGIRLGHDYPGSCYRRFQEGLLRLHHRGILLAVNSKNNAADALDIIDNHPSMVLRRKHFAALQINWNDKAGNLKAIAEELNIGIDSMLFIDDNPAECELVRRHCPGCEAVCLPGQAYRIPDVLRDLPGIENIRLTDEDRKKGELYQARAAGKEHERQFANLDDFLSSLDIQVAIEPATPATIPRIAQLTQKTNQMNLTTRRYSEAAIRQFVNDPNNSVFSVSSRDRFGDNGIVGVIILMREGEACRIDTFLLSCRVIGRNIEQAMTAFIVDFAGKQGATTVIGEYLPTAKNRPAAGMYERFRFRMLNDTLGAFDLAGEAVPCPPSIRLEAGNPIDGRKDRLADPGPSPVRENVS